ncbi:NAD dependent epimerase/dehydratase [Pestalotiopsis sp. NC0098]|nr:NAD dependent epimerase/dehydratase [Pestalotiopsis sp. NC0098]
MSNHVLLLGGSGKIAQLLTPLLLQRSWNVTSIIRNPDQVANLQKLGESQSGKLNVLVRSLEDVKSEAQAKTLIDEVKPNYVVWSAGAGGKGAPERTDSIDRDAAIHFIKASAATQSITKFLMVSFTGSRVNKAPWYSDADWADYLKIRAKLQRYSDAKIAADEVLYLEGKKRSDFAAINLRPGTLTDEPAGKVELGRLKTPSGKSSRASVAQLAALLLDNKAVKSAWLDMLDGNEDPEVAVQRVVKEGIDDAEGEPFF